MQTDPCLQFRENKKKHSKKGEKKLNLKLDHKGLYISEQTAGSAERIGYCVNQRRVLDIAKPNCFVCLFSFLIIGSIYNMLRATLINLKIYYE